jgi:hypothetical protein
VEGEIVEQCRVKTTREAIKWRFEALKPAVIAIEVGTHSRWVSQLLSEFGHEVIVANAREIRAITGSDRRSDRVDAEKLARYARVDRTILRPIKHRGEEAQMDLVVIQARAALVKTKTQLVNSVRGMVKSFGYRMPKCSPLLSIPAIRDRVVQGALKLILEPIFEADFQSGSYGQRHLGSSSSRISRGARKLPNFSAVLRDRRVLAGPIRTYESRGGMSDQRSRRRRSPEPIRVRKTSRESV